MQALHHPPGFDGPIANAPPQLPDPIPNSATLQAPLRSAYRGACALAPAGREPNCHPIPNPRMATFGGPYSGRRACHGLHGHGVPAGCAMQSAPASEASRVDHRVIEPAFGAHA